MSSPCLSHHSATFKVHRPCESGDITLFIYHATMILKGHVTLLVGPLILSPNPARFGADRPCGSGNNGVCSISSNSSSNSNSNTEFPMPRFTNGQNLYVV